MGKYISNFDTTSAYEAAASSLEIPHVSLTKDNMAIHYKSYDPYNGHDYVDLGLPSGLKWANKNIGALTITDYGQKFQWGDIQGFTHDQVSDACKAFSWADYKYSNNGGSSASDMTKYTGTNGDGLVTLEAIDDAAVANMGGSWRMPTETEFNELLNMSNCTKAWTTNYNETGINGYLFTSVRNSNTLFFPADGLCVNGIVNYVGSRGYYWSSSLHTSNVINGRYLFFYSGECGMYNNARYSGYAVRGVTET